MTDSELRRLEREFRQSGTLEAEAAWLRARLKAGELHERDLELAACLGHESARTILGSDSAFSLLLPLPRVEWEARDACAAFVEQFGIVRALRVCLPIAWTSLEDWSALFPEDRRPRSAIEAAEAWAVCPCESHRLGSVATVNGADEAADRAAERELIDERAVAAGEAASEAEACAGLASGSGGWFFEVVGIRLRAQWDSPQSLPNAWTEVLQAVQGEVVPWALGYSDPVRERVEARQREAAGE